MKSEINIIVCSVLRGDIEKLLQNRFVYELFWKHHNNPAEARNWEALFKADGRRARRALNERRTTDVLCELFHRLNTLRNQLVHGGATFRSSMNRHQVEPGARIMSVLIPNFIDAMIQNPNAGWGVPRYPVVRDGRPPQSGWPPSPEPADDGADDVPASGAEQADGSAADAQDAAPAAVGGGGEERARSDDGPSESWWTRALRRLPWAR